MKISIITITYNAENLVEKTILSVLSQTYNNIEYIVIDGASTDKTMSIVNKYKDNISIIISEPDKGISDAWNKGLKLASGDVIGLLNAGDEHHPDAVSNAIKAIQAGADLTYGDTELVDDDGKVLMVNNGRFHLWKYSGGIGFYHPSCFATRALYQKIGGFSLKLKYAMDTDWIIRAAVAGARICHAGNRTKMVDGGVSVKNRFLALGEHFQALHDNGAGASTAYKSMIMTGLRGLARIALKGNRTHG
jgi:glycosyltransferase involved in cell wall biosynthesis